MNNILEGLGIVTATKDWKNVKQTSEDLVANISGVDITKSSNTGIDDVIAGVTLNFSTTGTSTLSVSNDTDSIKTMIQDFVTSYNTAMTTLEEQMKVDSSSGDLDIASGTLQSESLIRSMHMKLRTLVTGSDSNLNSDYDSLRKIGIWTSGESNRLTIDADTLDNALADHFDAIQDLFRDYDYGIVRKVDEYVDSLTSPIDGSISSRITSLQNSMDDREDQIFTIEDRLTRYENSLYEQFAKMEQAMAAMQSQMGYVSGLLGNNTSQ